jgi:hypothetical protein
MRCVRNVIDGKEKERERGEQQRRLFAQRLNDLRRACQSFRHRRLEADARPFALNGEMARQRIADGIDDFVPPLEEAVGVGGHLVPGVRRQGDERNDDERDGDEGAAGAAAQVRFEPFLHGQQVNARDDAQEQRHQHLADEHEEEHDGEQQTGAVNEDALGISHRQLAQPL